MWPNPGFLRPLPPAAAGFMKNYAVARAAFPRSAARRRRTVAGVVIARAMGTLVYASVCHFEPPVDAKAK
jgi:hypothetical protein